jgi:hypothetical protein
MAGKSDRDKCFEEAVDAYNKAYPEDKIPIETQKKWVIDGGKWRPMSTLESIWDWIRGGSPYRTPDWTLTIDGKPVAGDNKFDGDRFSNRKGRSGKTQLEDQNDMNQQNHPDNPDYQDLNLNSQTCKCDGTPQKEVVYELEPATAFDMMFSPLPENVPLRVPSSAPVRVPIRVPIRIPIPIFP